MAADRRIEATLCNQERIIFIYYVCSAFQQPRTGCCGAGTTQHTWRGGTGGHRDPTFVVRILVKHTEELATRHPDRNIVAKVSLPYTQTNAGKRNSSTQTVSLADSQDTTKPGHVGQGASQAPRHKFRVAANTQRDALRLRTLGFAILVHQYDQRSKTGRKRDCTPKSAMVEEASSSDEDVPHAENQGAGPFPAGGPPSGGPGAGQRLPPDYARWVMIYPCYLDVTRPARLGRKLPKSKLVSCALWFCGRMRRKGECEAVTRPRTFCTTNEGYLLFRVSVSSGGWDIQAMNRILWILLKPATPSGCHSNQRCVFVNMPRVID